MLTSSNAVASKRSIKSRVGISLMGIAGLWSFTAAWFSAKRVIPVAVELPSYWLALLIIASGASLCLGDMRHPKPVKMFLFRSSVVASAFLVFLSGWLLSDRMFFFWKRRDISSMVWSQMAADLQDFGRRSADGSGSSPFRLKGLPNSLRQLGMETDYIGGSGQIIDSSLYQGLVVEVDFGYKTRTWGLFVGPTEILESRWAKCIRIQVALDAFLFLGAGG